MLTRLYIEALVVDEEQAGQVWKAWNKGEIDDRVAWGSSPIIHSGMWLR